MSKKEFLLIVGILLLIGTILTLSNLSKTSEMPFIPIPLIDATEEEINKAAIDYTYYRFEVLSGVPSVMLNMRITKGDLPSLGLSSIGSSGGKRQMALVLLKGDFDVHNLRGPHQNSPLRVQFIVYVIALDAGVPTLIECSADGDRFDKLLSLVEQPKELPINIEFNAPILEPHRESQPTVKSPFESLGLLIYPKFDFSWIEP